MHLTRVCWLTCVWAPLRCQSLPTAVVSVTAGRAASAGMATRRIQPPGQLSDTRKVPATSRQPTTPTNTAVHCHPQTQQQQQHTFNGLFSGTIQVSKYQKGKTNLDFTKARDSGISWAICKSAPRSRQITTPAPHHSSFFTGRMPFLPPNQQRQSTEGTM